MRKMSYSNPNKTKMVFSALIGQRATMYREEMNFLLSNTFKITSHDRPPICYIYPLYDQATPVITITRVERARDCVIPGV